MDLTAHQKRTLGTYGELTDSVEELLGSIAGVDSPDVKRIRAEVRVALAAARSAWGDTKTYAGRRVSRVLHGPGDYVRESPLRTIGFAALIGVAVGALLAWPRAHS